MTFVNVKEKQLYEVPFSENFHIKCEIQFKMGKFQVLNTNVSLRNLLPEKKDLKWLKKSAEGVNQ